MTQMTRMPDLECVACRASGLNGPQCVQTPVEDISVWTRIYYMSVSPLATLVCKRWTVWIGLEPTASKHWRK